MNNDSLDQKLSLILKQQEMILNELAVVRKQRQEIQELKEDLTFIARDVFQTAVTEMEDVAPFVESGDFLNLFKKLLRNTRNITSAIEKFDSMLDFMEDGKPIGKELFNDLLSFLDELDRKGYFAFMKELTKVADNIVTHFSDEDVRLLGDNIVTILETVRNLSQPDMLQSINNAVSIYKNLDITHIEEYTMWRAFREMNTPELKKGIGFIMTFLKNLSIHQKELNLK